MDKFQILALKNSVTVYEAAQLLARESGGDRAAESLIKEAITSGELTADGLHPERHLENFSFHDQHGINIMGTTVLRADLDSWLSSKGLSIDLRVPAVVPILQSAEVQVAPAVASPPTETPAAGGPVTPAMPTLPLTALVSETMPLTAVALGRIDEAVTSVIRLKKHALIQKYQVEWPTARADLDNNSRNKLSVAMLGGGFYNELSAVKWAEEQGKL